MILNLRDIPEGHSTFEQTVSMTNYQKQNVEFSEDVFCRAEIDRNSMQICLSIRYRCGVIQECSRCLKSFSLPLDGKLTVMLGEKEKRQISRKSENDDDNDYYDYIFKEFDTVIDIRQSLYDEVMINIPIKPLCLPDCKGINYKTSTSEIEKETINCDPRWDVLKQLKNL